MVYASDVIERSGPNKHDYRTKDEILEVFDAPSSRVQLLGMIETYNQKTEGIMALITDYSNATFFVTVRLL